MFFYFQFLSHKGQRNKTDYWTRLQEKIEHSASCGKEKKIAPLKAVGNRCYFSVCKSCCVNREQSDKKKFEKKSSVIGHGSNETPTFAFLQGA